MAHIASISTIAMVSATVLLTAAAGQQEMQIPTDAAWHHNAGRWGKGGSTPDFSARSGEP
jgi:hypothetical protein